MLLHAYFTYTDADGKVRGVYNEAQLAEYVRFVRQRAGRPLDDDIVRWSKVKDCAPMPRYFKPVLRRIPSWALKPYNDDLRWSAL